MVTIATTTIQSKLKQPAGLYNLFFVELWERFGFYCVEALLVLYLIKVHHVTDTKAYDLFSAFSALIYATPVLGGYLADRLLGFRQAIILGSILYFIGYAALASMSHYLFYPALALLICGNGFFKSCVSSLVGTLYNGEDDPRRDSGFTIFYMGINLGVFFAPIVSTWLAFTFGWGYGLGSAAIGILIGLATALIGFKKLGTRGLPTNPALLNKVFFAGISMRMLFYLGLIVAIFLLVLLINNASLADHLLDVFTIAMLIVIAVISFRYDREQRNRMWALIILLLFSVVFWALYTQMFSSLILFLDRVVNRHFYVWNIPASTYTSVEAFFIIVCSPAVAYLWLRLSKTRWNPSTGMKFALGLFFVGVAFLTLPLSILVAKNHLVNQSWVILFYFLVTLGELCLSPIGLAMITALAPTNITGMMMGVWFLTLSAGFALGDYIADLTNIPATMTDPQQISAIYSHTYAHFGIVALVIALILLTLTPTLKRLMNEHQPQKRL